VKRINIFILSFLFFLSAYSSFGYIADARLAATKTNIEALKTALISYWLDHNEYPRTESWKEDILKYVSDGRIPKDGWGQDFIYINNSI
jgi:hypothetical protein